jgi:mono/diheme cytochrome c family protein
VPGVPDGLASSKRQDVAKGAALRRFVLLMALVTILGSVDPTVATAQDLEFPEEFMTDMTVIREGRDLFQQQCGHCHGSRAYPGKAPRLRPDRYEPDFVFWVIQGGYGGCRRWARCSTTRRRKRSSPGSRATSSRTKGRAPGNFA